jgi:hypothetical protein
LECRRLLSTLSISATPSSVGEAGGAGTFFFNRTMPFPPGGPHYAAFQMSGAARSASPDADYTLSGYATFDPATGAGTVMLSPMGTATVTLTSTNDSFTTATSRRR